jgi:hypothetical protein
MLFAQGLTTNATKDDWEEINFEFNSSVLVDGYPSLLRLAELLHQNAEYRVTVDGNADGIGSNRYNDKLAASRATMVQSFLVKYGAGANQITVMAHGKRQPKATNGTKEGRFVNRRVVLTVLDGQGKVVSAGGVGSAIKAMQATEASQRKKCCEEVLKRLDKLDDILAAIKDLKADNDRLKQDVAALKQGQAGVEKQVAELPKTPDKTELQRMMDATANNAIQQAKPNRFSLLGINVGPSLSDVTAPWEGKTHNAPSITFTGKGRYFAPFGKQETSAVQAEGEYMYYRDRQEGQFDIGLVNRWSRVQGGLFSSVKHVNLTGLGGATVGQAAFTADVLFSRGRLGVFGTKAYLDNRVVGRQATAIPGRFDADGNPVLNHNLWNEYYLRVVDQFGVSGQVGVWKDAYIEANLGALFRSAGGNRPGGTVRLVQPFSAHIAGTIEASLNETMVGSKNQGRIGFGVQFGNWLRPKEYLEVKHPVPVDIPRVRYEVLSRRVRTGHTPPVANAGPDQVGVAAGTITLDGSGSYSPEGLALTYQWNQINGPSVAIANSKTATTTFVAAAGHTYQFRLAVTDSLGAQAVASVTISTSEGDAPRITSFTANPTSIRSGATSTLAWTVAGADSVEISGVGSVNATSGSTTVAPTQTTSYTLTARNSHGSSSQSVTVTVNASAVRIVLFQATPASIASGQTSSLMWQTENADSVTITTLGSVAVAGSSSVAPTSTTTYTLTASNSTGQASASITVTVTGGAPSVTFTATPTSITAGQSAKLTWTTTNVSRVYIVGLGYVTVNGSADVTPAQTTTYRLNAAGANGQTVSKEVTVIVAAAADTTPPTIVISGGYNQATQAVVYTLDGSGTTNAGGGTLTYHWSGPADSTIFSPNQAVTAVSRPAIGTYRYTLTVTNRAGLSSSADVMVTFLPEPDPGRQ